MNFLTFFIFMLIFYVFVTVSPSNFTRVTGFSNVLHTSNQFFFLHIFAQQLFIFLVNLKWLTFPKGSVLRCSHQECSTEYEAADILHEAQYFTYVIGKYR